MHTPISLSARRAFALVELLAIVMIVAALVLLFLPAIQQSRESARRLHCQTNLRQIGIALASYIDLAGCFPPGRMKTYDPRYVQRENPCSVATVDKSFLVSLLPHLEQTNLYNSLNHDLFVCSIENATVQSSLVAVYTCPSDPDAWFPRDLGPRAFAKYGIPDPPTGNFRMSTTSYSGILGPLLVTALPIPQNRCRPSGLLLSQTSGCLNDLSPIRLASVTDGLSSTMVLTEKSITLFDRLYGSNSQLIRNHGWLATGNWGDTLLTTMYPPNSHLRLPRSALEALSYSASSLHPGGVNTLWCDGSSRFVKDSVQSWPLTTSGNPLGTRRSAEGAWLKYPALGVWQAVSTRNGGEIVTIEDF